MGVSKVCVVAASAGIVSAPIVRSQNIAWMRLPAVPRTPSSPPKRWAPASTACPRRRRQLLVDDTIKQILSAGWQTVTYRQNTDCTWKPGTGILRNMERPAGKGYFTAAPPLEQN